ncbi:MAG: OprO/OprP family phosphate-selective porin [Syntrophales bacterium]|jgi:hypothetical protein|nr:OprO/OprP family phosphate-selective porin [Syntrophales bacterium]
MPKNRITAKLAAVVLGVALLAGTAYAGPQVKFGPKDEGLLQLDYKGQLQMTMRDNGSGTNKESATYDFNFRRNRLALMGKYGELISIYVQTEYTEHQDLGTLTVSDTDSGYEFQMLDAVVRFNFADAFKVNAGKFKYNLSRENLEACEMPLTLDRSLFIRAPYVTTRDKGIAIWGNLFDDMFQYRADVMEGRNATTAAAPQPESSFRYSVRGHVTLLDPENDYGYKGTYLGNKQVLTIGAAYQFEPDVAYADTVAKTDAKDYKAWTADIFFEYPIENFGTVTASAAYEDIDLGNAYKGFNPDPDTIGLKGEKNGFYVKAGYMLPNTPLQFFARYEKWAFANLNGIVDQEVEWYGGGFNYYIRGQNLKITLEASNTSFDKGTGTSADSTESFMTFVAQLQVIF